MEDTKFIWPYIFQYLAVNVKAATATAIDYKSNSA